MFFHNRKREQQMAMLRQITPISKASLKRQCLMIAEGDLKKAKEFYDFWAEGMEAELPTFDPKEPSWMDNFGSRVNGILGWVKENQGVLTQGYDLISNLIGRRGATAIEAGAEALEEINEG